MNIPSWHVELAPVDGFQHRSDLISLKSKGLAVPHGYSSGGIHYSGDRTYWVRFTDLNGTLLSGFVLRLSRSRLVPGTWIGRVERFGRALHNELADPGAMLDTLSRKISWLQRLDVEVFDELPSRRLAIERSLLSAGAVRRSDPENYSHTLALDLSGGESELLQRLSPRARRSLRKFHSAACALVEPITSETDVPRMAWLYRETFARTGREVSLPNLNSILACASSDGDTFLSGVYWSARREHERLVAFVWGRLHGDHASYDIGASERAPDLGQIPLGYPLMFALARWAQSRGATWLDLGGIVPEYIGNDGALRGIAEFKHSFSEHELEVASEYSFFPNRVIQVIARGLRTWVRIGSTKSVSVT